MGKPQGKVVATCKTHYVVFDGFKKGKESQYCLFLGIELLKKEPVFFGNASNKSHF